MLHGTVSNRNSCNTVSRTFGKAFRTEVNYVCSIFSTYVPWKKLNIFLTQADPSRTMSVPLIKVPHAWWIFRVKKKTSSLQTTYNYHKFIFFAGLRLSNCVSQFQLLESKFVFIRSFKVLSWKRTLVEKKVQSKNKFPCMFFLSDCCLGQNPGRSPFSHFCFRLVPSAESATTTMSIKFRMKHLLRWCTQPCQHLR